MRSCDRNSLESDDTEEELEWGSGGVKLATEANEAESALFSIFLLSENLLDVEALRS